MAEGNGARIARIAYGRGRIPLRVGGDPAVRRIITPREETALEDPEGAFRAACAQPTGTRPLREIVGAGDRVVIVTSDGTRPVPNRQLIPWILDELPCPDSNVTVLLGTGTHRPNTPDEILDMFGEEIVSRVAIENHDAFDDAMNPRIGTSVAGAEIRVDRRWLEADRRIVVGFIEPHFFAGFSGGPKGVIPGVAGINTILHLHNYEMIAHPSSTFGVLDGNPIHETIREMVSHCPPDFMVNVTLNGDKRITAVFAGDHIEAHRAGCERVRRSSMAAVDRKYPLVVTSNSGYPLDQNLYQTVKGIAAAARITEDGGTILVASECSDGLPAHGRFGELFAPGGGPDAALARLRALDRPVLDQWQVQILSDIGRRCEIAIHSGLSAEQARLCGLRRVEDFQRGYDEAVASVGADAGVAVLPDGPLTIAYVRP